MTKAIELQVKGCFATLKKGIKGNYLPEEWDRFGVLDKR